MGSVNDTTSPKVVLRFRFFKVYEDGRLEPKASISKVPPVEDLKTGVQSRDVLISTTPSISARIFMPKPHLRNKRHPLLYYVHGGGFCMDSAFSPMYCTYLNSIVGQAQVIAVSVDYHIYQESPIPACYQDSWAGLKWASTHFDGNGPDPWLNNFADCEDLKRSKWTGIVDLVENKGTTHGFYLDRINDVEAVSIRNRICMFLNQAHSSI